MCIISSINLKNLILVVPLRVFSGPKIQDFYQKNQETKF